MENYYFTSHEITPVTMAILSLRDVNGDAVTRVIEEDAEYVVDHSPQKSLTTHAVFSVVV